MIDGANRWQLIRYITIPLMETTIRTSAYLSVLGSLTQFNLVWILTGGGPVHASEVMATYMYQYAFKRLQLGYGSAVALVMLVICLTFSVIFLQLNRRPDYLGQYLKGAYMAADKVQKRSAFMKKLPRFFQYLVLTIFTLIIIVPIVIMVFGALKTRGEMFTHPYTLPIPPHWENFGVILKTPSFWLLLRNSVIVMVFSTAGVLAVCSLAAFVFARMQFRGKDLAFNILTLGLMFPITVAIMPVYLVIRQMKLIDSPTSGHSGADHFRDLREYPHPPWLFSIDPHGVARCRFDGRLFDTGILLVHPAPVGAPGFSRGGRLDHDRQLE